MNVITATGQIWRQKYASPREGRFPSATAGREDLQGAAVIRYFRGTISRKVRTDCKDKDIKGLKDRYTPGAPSAAAMCGNSRGCAASTAGAALCCCMCCAWWFWGCLS